MFRLWKSFNAGGRMTVLGSYHPTRRLFEILLILVRLSYLPSAERRGCYEYGDVPSRSMILRMGYIEEIIAVLYGVYPELP